MISIKRILEAIYNGAKSFVRTFINVTKKMLEYVAMVVIGVVFGTIALISWIGSGVARLINKFFSYDKNTDKWTETIVTQEIDANEVPEHIRQMAGYGLGKDVDITHELEMQLG